MKPKERRTKMSFKKEIEQKEKEKIIQKLINHGFEERIGVLVYNGIVINKNDLKVSVSLFDVNKTEMERTICAYNIAMTILGQKNEEIFGICEKEQHLDKEELYLEECNNILTRWYGDIGGTKCEYKVKLEYYFADEDTNYDYESTMRPDDLWDYALINHLRLKELENDEKVYSEFIDWFKEQKYDIAYNEMRECYK